jgi:hypothetical protein
MDRETRYSASQASINLEATVGFWSNAFANGRSVYEASPSLVFQACLRAAAECRFGVVNANADVMFLQVQTRERSRHWDGVLSVTVIPEGAGAIVTISDPVTRVPVTLGELAASGGAGLTRGKLEAAIRRLLPSIVQARHSTIETDTPHSLADEVTKLKQLLDAGVLTEAEFAAAKRRALG